MSRSQCIAAALLLPFAAFSCWVTAEEGFLVFFTAPFTHPVWTQEFLDLCISLSLVMGWMAGDGRRRGIRVWPYLVLTPLLGSLAPLAYLVFRRQGASSGQASPPAPVAPPGA